MSALFIARLVRKDQGELIILLEIQPKGNQDLICTREKEEIVLLNQGSINQCGDTASRRTSLNLP
jgi:hypothetical protein